MVERISPELVVDLDGHKVTLCGTLAVLKKLQIVYDCDIVQFQEKIIEARFDVLAQMFEICANSPEVKAADFEAWILDHCGIDEAKYILIEFWIISVSPQKKRENNREMIQGKIANLRKAAAFLGESTERFA
jgi:hypothetical protein